MWIHNACAHILTSCDVRLIVRRCEICHSTSKEVSLDFGYEDRPVPPRTLGISLYSHASSIHPSLFLRLFERLFCISVCGVVRWFLRGLTPMLPVTVALWNPTEAQSGLTGSRSLDPLPVVWLKLAWKQCRGGRMTSWHPTEEHAIRAWIPFKCTHREEHTRNIYVCTILLMCTE